MKKNDRVCCCFPVRLGVLLMSFTIFCIYLVGIILMSVYKAELEAWSISDQTTDRPLTVEAFKGVFYSFVISFGIYDLISIFGVASIIMQHRRMVRVYHVLNWFFVLLLFTTTVAFWIYFKVHQDVYVNDCQAQQNINSSVLLNDLYTPIKIPGKPTIAGGSDKSDCIKHTNQLVIGSGVCLFLCNIIQLYWARSIGKYATTLKRHYQHLRIEVKDDDSTVSSSKSGSYP